MRAVIHKLALISMLSLISAFTFAHERSESYSQWQVKQGKVVFQFSLKARQVTALAIKNRDQSTLAQLLSQHLQHSIQVFNGDRRCELTTDFNPMLGQQGFMKVNGVYQCADADTFNLTINSFMAEVANHIHYAKINVNGVQYERVFTQANSSHEFISSHETDEAGAISGVWQYLWVGVEHILMGPDHLVFLLALLMLASNRRGLIWLISGFTLGHSISIALAFFQLVKPDGNLIEAFIGFSIVLLVLERLNAQLDFTNGQNLQVTLGLALIMVTLLLFSDANRLWLLSSLVLFSFGYLTLINRLKNAQPLRLIVTTLFGLVHGFGFASGMVQANFSAQNIGWILLGFNLGIELGQIFILLLLCLFYFILPKQGRRLAQGANLSLAGLLGMYWFTSRWLL